MTEFPAARMVQTNGIRLAVYEAGNGPPIILLHGFPELAFSWRHQLPALAAAGYRAIAPDLRGYGLSDKPPGVADYRQEEIFDDIAGLLGEMGQSQAIFIAHDWGALIAWQMALVRPELLRGLIALNIPFMPRRHRDPVQVMRERFGPNYYIVNFQDSDEADRLFDSDPRRFIDRIMRRDGVTRRQFNALPDERRIVNMIATMNLDRKRGEALLTEDELDFYAKAFSAGGFSGPINWYRNWTRNWKSMEDIEQKVRMPVLFIGADNDVVVTPQQIKAMKNFVPDLESHVLDDCGHWTQQEKPGETNALMLDWLRRRFPAE
ncbi:MAG: alpha/beta hydrolase [Woeseia sp.]|nr:alpha/beta hydrolase [Woeseia sp.]